jgi:hypothetical protein
VTFSNAERRQALDARTRPATMTDVSVRGRDRYFAVAFVVGLVLLGLLVTLWFGTTFLGWVVGPQAA